MSQTGEIVFFAQRTASKTREILAELWDVFGGNAIQSIRMSHEIDRSFDLAKQGVESEPAWEELGKTADFETVCESVEHSALSVIDFGNCPALQRVRKNLERIPLDIRGDFEPQELSLTIGGHDLFEFSENPEGTYLARACLSTKLWGYGSPNDWNGYRSKITDNEGIILMKQELSRLGKIKVVCYWWV